MEQRDRMILLKRELNALANNNKNVTTPSQGHFQACIGALNKYLGGRENRISFLQWAFGSEIQSSKDLTGWQRFAIVKWVKPYKFSDDSPWTTDAVFRDDCFILKTFFGGNHEKT